LPAGSFHVNGSGFQSTAGGHILVEILLRHPGSADQTLFSSIETIANTQVDKTFGGGPFPAACGDGLVLRMTLVTASSGFIEFGVSADIP
jgi:hypothetical protein